MKKSILFISAVLIAFFLQENFDQSGEPLAPVSQDDVATSDVPESFRSGAQTQGSGIVVRILSDDKAGGRHQRFLIRLHTGRTLLIAHNIDLAPRVSSLREGDTVAFNGIFESNEKGGVIHWTHRDPQGRHEAGWLKHNGHTYQ